jgi:predicted enzyme related to lactoylglutathione lyase
MIKGVHTLLYTTKPEELRAFIRDKLGFSFTDVGEGWLIFDAPEADMGCHPAMGSDSPSGTHNVSFYCDDIERTVRDLKAKGVKFTKDVTDVGYGLSTRFEVPGDFTLELYQPKYQKGPARA